MTPDTTPGTTPGRTPDTSIDATVRRELLRLALVNAEQTIPLLLLAVVVVVVLGVSVQAHATAFLAAAIGMTVAVWRYRLARRYGKAQDLDERQMQAATRGLEGNASLAGLLWATCSFGVFPYLQGSSAIVYVVIAIGSVATGVLFMSLVGRSFQLLVLLSFGAFVGASLAFEQVRSFSAAALVALLGWTMIRAGLAIKDTTTSAIRHSLEKDLANASLAKAKEAAEAATLAKSQFLATMSHEIRTPMNGVLGALDLLRHSSLDATQRRLVRTAASSGTSLMTILNDVLDHSKIEAGKLNLVNAPVSPKALAASAVTLFRANAESKGLSLTMTVADDVAPWVLCDAQRLKQVVLNLVGNAIKFTEHGSVSLCITARPAPAGWAGLRIEVQDSGVGLSAQAQQELFQPFHQVESSRTRQRGGTGLGLVISQSIIQAMGGRIEVESRPGEGSRFWFDLVLECDESPDQAAAGDSSLIGLDGQTKLEGTVLVVEDNDVNRLIAREMLGSMGLNVIEACDGAKALEQLAANEVDLILMDCQMPVMDGYAAAREIRECERRLARPRIPILALTANAFDEDAVRARESGMDAHIAKPYTRAHLLNTLNNWL
ncbi:MAG: ATP-binding protein [Burkholderiaceae bacterium]